MTINNPLADNFPDHEDQKTLCYAPVREIAKRSKTCMPSHIFARLGLWQEDIASNLASLRASQNSSAVHVGAENQLHAMEFLEYAYLQVGEEDKAEAMVEEGAKIAYEQVDPNLHDYVNRTRANSPALYYLQTRNWKATEALRPDPTAEPYNQAITFWAQAVAAGHTA